MTTPILPDAEAVVVTWLKGNSNVAAKVGTRAFFGTPRDKTISPWITVRRVGGSPDKYVPIDIALIDIFVWGGIKDKLSAAAPARIVASEIHALTSGTSVTGGIIQGAYVTLGPWWAPEALSDRARYLITAQFTILGT